MPRGANIVRLPAIVLALIGAVVVSGDVHGQILHGRRERVTEASIRGHMEMLASDAMNGRGSGTRDEWLAATYIASQLRRFGLEPLGDGGDFVQEVETLRREVTAPPVLTVGDARFTHGHEVLVEFVGAPHAAGPLVRFARGAAIPAGAVVLVIGPGDPPADAIARAAAVLSLVTPTVLARWDTTVNPQVAASGTGPWRVSLGRDAFLAMNQLVDGAAITLDAEVRPGRTWNVLGRIPGTGRAREVILLSAHLDHIGVRGTGADTINNGADDDASGVTAVLELARVLADGRRPDRTVIVALFGSEEAGGFGARHFLDHPPVPLETIVANLEFEMIGRPDPKVPPHTLWLTGYERSTLGPALARRGARIVADPHPDQDFFTRSDNIQLARRGVVAQTISSYGLHRDYHTPADDLAHIDFAHMTASIASMVAPVEWLARSSFTPQWLPGMKPDER